MTRTYRPTFATLIATFALTAVFSCAATAEPAEPEIFRKDVASGKMPPLQKRLPATPLVYPMEGPDRKSVV